MTTYTIVNGRYTSDIMDDIRYGVYLLTEMRMFEDSARRMRISDGDLVDRFRVRDHTIFSDDFVLDWLAENGTIFPD